MVILNRCIWNTNNYLYIVVIIAIKLGWLLLISKEPVLLPEDLDVSGDVIIQNGILEQRQMSGFGAIVVETAK